MHEQPVSPVESVLNKVARPARYTGGEWNCVSKPWERAGLHIALCYPDVYEVGMSNLALPVLYELLNARPDIVAERVFPPWTDMEEALRATRSPLRSLESGRPLSEFNVVAFSLGYELTYTNVLTVLDLGGIPLLCRERSDRHPLVIAGGSCTVNPEPMTDFIDLFFIGEVEDKLGKLIDCLLAHAGGRARQLRAAAQLGAVYVPSLYQPRHDKDGAFERLAPGAADVPEVIERAIVTVLPPPPTHPVVPFTEAVHDYGSVEIQRGCTRGCRFCQAGMIYRPSRARDRAQVVAACEELTRNCGYSDLSLLSLSSSDYPEIEGLVSDLEPLCRRDNITLSLPSLRLGPESVRLLGALPGRRGSSFTFAPEAGTERLRQAINKNVSEEDVFSTLQALREGGWTKLKFYFMIGLPTETEDDVEGIASLVRRVIAADRSLRLNVSVSLLVPKPHTPFQWDAQSDATDVEAKVDILKRGLRTDRVKLSWPDTRTSQVEAALSRGDRRVGAAILRAWQAGSRFDAWGECFDYERWRSAFESCGLRLEDFANRARSLDEPLPWSHIATGVSADYLKDEHRRALANERTADCRTADCNACGLHVLAGGCPSPARTS